jgi:hypothetical protein
MHNKDLDNEYVPGAAEPDNSASLPIDLTTDSPHPSEGEMRMENQNVTTSGPNLPEKGTQAGHDHKPIPTDAPWEQALLGTTFNFKSLETDPGPDPFHIMGLTPTFAACLRYISRRSGISDGMVIGTFLTGVSSILLPRITVLTYYGKEVGVNVYAQTNAPSSSRKSDMFNPLQQLIIDHDSKRRGRILEINNDQRVEREVWKVTVDALKKQLSRASKLSKVEEIDILADQYQQCLTQEPASLPNLSILQGDATPAAIMQALYDNRGCVTLYIDEGLLLYQKILNNEVHHINTAWSGAALDKTTIRGGNIYVEKPRLASHTFMQNDVFTKLSRGKSFSFLKDSGYFSRALICAPKVGPENNALPEYMGSEAELTKLLAYLKEQIAINYPLDGLFSGKMRTLKLSADAENLARSYYDAIQSDTKLGGVYYEMPEFCGKASEHIHRLAALIHGIEQDETDEISYSTMCAAIRVFDWYCTEHWRLIVKEGRPLNVEACSGKLTYWLRHRQDRYQVEWVRIGDIPHHVECFRGNPDMLDDAIRYLIQKGDLSSQSGRRKGRKGGFRWHEVRLSDQFLQGERYIRD